MTAAIFAPVSREEEIGDGAPVVALRGVVKSYGAVQAVKGIDLEIRRGETVALLGPNGAGKTTTLSMLLGLLAPTAGSVQVMGTSPADAIRRSLVGAMLQEGKLMSGVRVGEFMDFVRSLHPNPLPKPQLLEVAGLQGLENRRLDRLSGGQSQRTRFAMAIAGDPELLVLDEPTAAMDVEARREFWASMRAYAAQGHTVLFATHYLEEAESFASRLVIIAQGSVIADGTVREIEERYGEPHVAFTLPDADTTDTSAFARYPGVTACQRQGARVTLLTTNADTTTRALAQSAVPWRDVEVKGANLEETFVALVHQGEAE
ncbi:MAG TPA: ABC transporter ATP-binding protein [Ktedonobacterales bacterium]|nr:ABC transporter ATP-binding protein [Ktedonobacterales bacterium]